MKGTASWRELDDTGDLSRRSSRARKLRRRKNAKAKPLAEQYRPREVLGRFMQTESLRHMKTVLQRLTIENQKPNMTHIGKAIGVFRHGLDPSSWDYGSLPKLLQELEKSHLEKMGSRTVYIPSKLKELIDNVHSPTFGDNIKKDVLNEAFHNVEANLAGLRRAKALSTDVVVDLLLVRQKDTSSGFPWFMKRYITLWEQLSPVWKAATVNEEKVKNAEETFPKLAGMDLPLQQANRIMSGESTDSPIYTANFRTEAGSDGPKLRLVWGAPMDNQIVEGSLAIPIQEMLKYEVQGINKGEWSDAKRDAINAEDARLGSTFMYCNGWHQMAFLRSLFGYAKAQDVDVISLDYAAFDSTISAELIRMAMAVLIGTGALASIITERFVVKELLHPFSEESLTKKVSGTVPSGSVFTNLVDGVVNAICIEYIALRTNREVAYRVNGDDSVAVFEKPVGKKAVSFTDLDELSLELGVIMNPTKQARSPDSCLFNKAYWGYEFPGQVPSANRVINSLVYRDNMMTGHTETANDECVRSLQIIDQLEDHPFRDRLIRKLVKYSYLEDGHSALDYRWRLPQANIATIMKNDKIMTPPSYVELLDKSWVGEVIYDE